MHGSGAKRYVSHERTLAKTLHLTRRVEAFDEHSTGFIKGNYAPVAAVGRICLTPRFRNSAGPSFAMPQEGCCTDTA